MRVSPCSTIVEVTPPWNFSCVLAAGVCRKTDQGNNNVHLGVGNSFSTYPVNQRKETRKMVTEA